MKTLYIVVCGGGEWEDRWQRNMGATTDKSLAEGRVAELKETRARVLARKEKQRAFFEDFLARNPMIIPEPEGVTYKQAGHLIRQDYPELTPEEAALVEQYYIDNAKHESLEHSIEQEWLENKWKPVYMAFAQAQGWTEPYDAKESQGIQDWQLEDTYYTYTTTEFWD